MGLCLEASPLGSIRGTPSDHWRAQLPCLWVFTDPRSTWRPHGALTPLDRAKVGAWGHPHMEGGLPSPREAPCTGAGI